MRNTAEIRSWMFRNGIKLVDIQRELSMKSATQVCETINGSRNDKRVLSWLKGRGCPDRFLAIPPDRREAA